MLDSFASNLNVVVFGASGGIGQAIAEQFLKSDKVGQLHACVRSDVSINDPRIRVHKYDLRDEATIENVALEISADAPIDIVVVATGLLHDGAGIAPEKSLRDINPTSFAQIFEVNTTGPVLIMKHFLPKLNREGKTLYAAISARVGSISDNQLGGWYAYRASKSALNMLIKTASIEVARKYKQACIIGLHPGTVDTNLSEPFKGNVAEGELFTPAYSAEYLVNVIDQVSPEDTGLTFAFDGQKIPF